MIISWICFVSGVLLVSSAGVDYSCLHSSSWQLNRDQHYSAIFKEFTGITSSSYSDPLSTSARAGSLRATASADHEWTVASPGIPRYDYIISASEVNVMNRRPLYTSDFVSAHTTATAGSLIQFGESIGYITSYCRLGYWPPGPPCPVAFNRTASFPIEPAPEVTPGGCYAGDRIGTFVSGAAAWGWSDLRTYLSNGVWHTLFPVGSRFDTDICAGSSRAGIYNHHGYSRCLGQMLGDDGSQHSPVHGFAIDGYPIYGPYQAHGLLAVPCWQKRDYSSASPTGCASGSRSCVLLDEFDYTRGTRDVIAGPSLTANLLSQSGNPILGRSGILYEDYYYNATCAAQGGEFLDQFNGHDHDGLGFHYHTTVDLAMQPVFPYIVGPKMYGCLRGGACPTAVLTPGSSLASQCGNSSALPVATQQCLNETFTMSRVINSTSNSSSSDDSSRRRSPIPTVAVVGIVIGGGVMSAVLFSLLIFHSSKSATIYVSTEVQPTYAPSQIPTAELLEVPMAQVVRFNGGRQY